MKLQISKQIESVCPNICLAIIRCEVINSETNDELKLELKNESEKILTTYTLEKINKRSEIYVTREVYKALGKDPNRYRPSAEALCRRILRKIPLYFVSTLVDCINIVSIRSGYSIGGFDLDKIKGDIELGVGTAQDEFEAIGRGLLNVQGLPLYRDSLGGIGTPTSDNERTKIAEDTTRLLIIINAYNGNSGLDKAIHHTLELLGKYGSLKNYTVEFLHSANQTITL